MSASANPLILGIGNPLRGDDGLGRAVVEELARSADLACNVQAVHQLTPELALSMKAASIVVMIDASRAGEPGDIRTRQILPSLLQPGPVGTHYATPEELAALTKTLYGRCPPVVIITMTGANFEMSEHLSPLVSTRLPVLLHTVRTVCAYMLPATCTQ